ncbi:UDP-Gal or UDP-GlcNAc-dependent glycosyltransferase, partial [Trypanosoma grayi]|uniref:UDP-Gal or UDP-GlcNAc-dependent glycosyltransferase n=1 Tax=Trypanosoma grayi TaxID=71804 RepID=UPI0004F43648
MSLLSRITENDLAPKVSFVEGLRYISRSVLDTWDERDYLIVLGIPSVDMDARRGRRQLQRTTLWTFPGVATVSNNFTGTMLTLYVIGRHPSHDFNFSSSLLEEATEWQDVIALPMNEGRSSTKKTIGGGGYWGME